MGFKQVLIAQPTYHSLRTCDTCAKQIDEVAHYEEFASVSTPDLWFSVTAESKWEGEDQNYIFCSLNCLNSWVKKEQTDLELRRISTQKYQEAVSKILNSRKE